MPAVVRGRPRQPAKARPKASTRSSANTRAQARGAAYPPAKIRAAQGVGLRPGPALAVAGGVVAVGVLLALFTGQRLQAAARGVGAIMAGDLAMAGFKVDAVHVEGATPEAQGDILRAAGLKRNEPILDLDLNALRGRIERVGWVKEARVVRLLPDTLVISVAQRPALAVWQHEGQLSVVDPDGQPIAGVDPARFSDLPLIVGDGAAGAAADILPLLRARPPLMQRLEALVRVDDRRWDLRLKDGGLIQLPAEDEESALIQLDQLEQTQRILELGFARIDLRDPEMVAVRPRDAAPAAPAAAVAGA